VAGNLGHVGVSVMALGMVVSSSLGQSRQLRLPEGESARALGYTLTYEGEETGPRGEQTLRIRVENGGFRYQARPKLLASPMGNGVIRTPAIHAVRDLYVSPVEVHSTGGAEGEPTWLTKGEAVSAAGATWTFTGFHFEQAPSAPMRITAHLDVAKDGRVAHVDPGMTIGPGEHVATPVQVPGLGALVLAAVDGDHSRVAVRLPGPSTGSVALVEISTKPMVNLVWIGALLTLAASSLAALRRAGQRAVRARASRSAGPALRRAG
jgi:cytochrome c-type biogenesis protein CcmF